MKKLTPQQLQNIASASVPTPSSGAVTLFADTDNKIKQKDSTGTVTDLTATGGGGGGSPGGSTTQVQFNNAGAFAGSPNVKIHGDDLMLALEPTPTLPTADHVKIFARKVGGRMMQAVMGPSGLDTTLQPHLGRNKIRWSTPQGNGTVISTNGLTLTATGTATSASVAVTNIHTMMARLDYLVTTASTTAVAGFRYAAAQFAIGHASNALLGGFHMICRWGPATGVATATNRAFVGMRSLTTAPTDVEPSSFTNIVGMGWDAADTNIQIMHRGTGAVTKIDLGASFPVPTTDRAEVYEIALFSPPGTTQSVGYEVQRLSTGAKAEGVITTNLPATTVLLAPQGYMSVGGTSSVIGISLMGMIIETDY